jgi:purine-binding chemotaxis protein CheW
MSSTGFATEANTQQFLTFKLAGEEYGVGILSVQEIRGWAAVTAIPQSPAWLLGVINLRGTVVPVIDLRLKFNYARADYNEFTVVIILNLKSRVVGIVVDGVSDVITLGSEQIKPAPPLGGNADTSHIIGFALGERMRMLMDVEKLVAAADLTSLKAIH